MVLLSTFLYASVRLHIKYALFLLLFRGIKALVDAGDLTAPPAPLGMLKGHDLVLPPVEIVGDKRHLPVEIILGIKPQPSRVKFRGTSKVLPQSGHTHCIVGGSTSLIL